MGLDVEVVEQHPKLGRQKVHDSRSLAFPVSVVVDRSKWQDKLVRLYDPSVNPNQCHGECTGCAKSMQLNAVGNRRSGVVLDMAAAHNLYSLATTLDPWPDEWPPEDTGSSGLASAKAAQKLGLGAEYRHVFGGADEVVQLIQVGYAVSVGTWWYNDMFTPDTNKVITPTGSRVGGHQYIARGYLKRKDLVVIRCWWGEFRDAYISRGHLNELLHDGGDAHIQKRA